jgi:hypothetical protein
MLKMLAAFAVLGCLMVVIVWSSKWWDRARLALVRPTTLWCVAALLAAMLAWLRLV